MRTVKLTGALIGLIVLAACLGWGGMPVQAADGLSFAGSTNYGVGSGPRGLTTGDFNGDGKGDLAIANYFSNYVSILLGNGDGTFQAAVNYGVGEYLQGITTSDFNGDGRGDLAVTNYTSDNVSILLGNGDGTFQGAVNYGVGHMPHEITVGDFNGDGKGDLAVANESSNNVSILLGNGNGTFRTAANSGVGDRPTGITTSDFNGDGRVDLAVANQLSRNVSILLSNGDGTFQAAAYYGVGSYPMSITTADFSGDGKGDLAVTDYIAKNVSILLSNGDGTFQAAGDYVVGTNPRGITTGDFNGDGKLDVAVANDSSDNVSILLGNGDGTFQAAASSPGVGKTPIGITTGDFNGDGKGDLAVTNTNSNNVSILLNTTYIPGVLGFDQPTLGVNEDCGEAVLTVKRELGRDGAVTVKYYTVDETAAGGQDYITTIEGSLTFAEGGDTKTISIPIIDNARGEPAETFLLKLTKPGGGAVIGSNNTIRITINDNDGIGLPGTIQFESETSSFDENSEWAEVNAKRVGGDCGQVQVDYYTSAGTAQAGTDYSSVTGTLIFADEQTEAVIKVPLINDSTQETDKTFNIVLGNPGGGAAIGTPNETVVTILDDESQPPAEVTGLTLIPDSGEITATWTDPGSAILAKIRLYIKPDGGDYGPAAEVAKGTETYTFTGLVNGQTYQIKVVTVNGLEMESTGITTEAAPVAAEVTGLTVLPGDGQIMALWHDSRNANLDKIHLYIKPDGSEYGPAVEVAKGTETYTFTGLTNGRTYQIKVVTVNGLGLESNGVVKEAVPTAPGALPDLVVNAVQVKGSAYPGSKVKVLFTVLNQGQAPSAKTDIKVYVLRSENEHPENCVAIKALSALKPPKSKNISLSVTLPSDLTGDNAYLLVSVDDSGVVAESDDWNNWSMITLELQYPDLAFSAAPVITGNLEAGAKITVQDTVVNQGGAPAGKCLVTYYIWDGSDPASKVKIGERNVAALKPGKASKGKAKLTLPGTIPPPCHLLMVIDETDQVKEKDEGNNQASV